MNYPSTNGYNCLKIDDLGLVDYQLAWDYQTNIHQELIDQKRNHPEVFNKVHTLILCEHPHVYTLGKSGKEEHLIKPLQELNSIQASFYKINRGGDITYHGPGQLVAYPILDLDKLFTDVHKYVRLLEESVIQVLDVYKIEGHRIGGLTGVWLDPNTKKARKICAIGVHLSRWVSLHGLAFNINTDLNYFNHIVPCGIASADKTVASLHIELGHSVEMEEVKEIFIDKFVKNFELNIESKINETIK